MTCHTKSMKCKFQDIFLPIMTQLLSLEPTGYRELEGMVPASNDFRIIGEEDDKYVKSKKGE